jgi:hypothetical protein
MLIVAVREFALTVVGEDFELKGTICFHLIEGAEETQSFLMGLHVLILILLFSSQFPQTNYESSFSFLSVG